jgi:hypothetical protein
MHTRKVPVEEFRWVMAVASLFTRITGRQPTQKEYNDLYYYYLMRATPELAVARTLEKKLADVRTV